MAVLRVVPDLEVGLDASRTRTLPIRAAAAELGVSVDALRKRVRRGSVRAVKARGVWQVVLPDLSGVSYAVESQSVLDTGISRGQDALVAAMRDEIGHLRSENARLLTMVGDLALRPHVIHRRRWWWPWGRTSG